MKKLKVGQIIQYSAGARTYKELADSETEWKSTAPESLYSYTVTDSALMLGLSLTVIASTVLTQVY